MLIENEGNGRFGAVFRGRSGTNPRAARRRSKQLSRILGTAVASRRTIPTPNLRKRTFPARGLRNARSCAYLSRAAGD